MSAVNAFQMQIPIQFFRVIVSVSTEHVVGLELSNCLLGSYLSIYGSSSFAISLITSYSSKGPKAFTTLTFGVTIQPANRKLNI